MPLTEQQWSGLLQESPEIQGQALAKHGIGMTPQQLQSLKLESPDVQKKVYLKYNPAGMVAALPEQPKTVQSKPEPSVESPVGGISTLTGKPVTEGMQGSKDPNAGLVGLVESVPTMATGLPAFIVGTFAKVGNGIVNSLTGMDKPWYTAVEQTDKFLQPFTYSPKTKEGVKATTGLTYGMIAYTAPYLLPFLGAGAALDSETAKKHLTDEQIARLKVANDVLMMGVPSAKEALSHSAAIKTAELASPAKIGVAEQSAMSPIDPSAKARELSKTPQGVEAETVTAGELRLGDTFTRNGQQFTVKSISPTGTVHAAGPDGALIHLPKYQTVTVDKGSMKLAKPANEAASSSPAEAPVNAKPPVSSTEPPSPIDAAKQATAQPLPEVTKEVTKSVNNEAFPGAGATHDEIFKLNPRSPEFREMIKAHPEIAEYRMTHDPLTRLLNRADYFGRLESDIKEKGSADAGQLDFDKFKPINDIFGHGAGDDVLKTFGKAVIDLGMKDNIFRIGGEEFGTRGFESPESRQQQLDKLSDYLSKTRIETTDGTTGETISWQGLPFSQGHATIKSLKEFKTHVDKALYKDKESRAGKGLRPGGNRLSAGLHLGPEAERLYRQRIGEGESLSHDEGSNARPGAVQSSDRKNPQQGSALTVSEPSDGQLPGAAQEVAPSITALDPKAVPVVRTPVSKIHLSEDVPNFKTEADEKTGIIPSEQIQSKEYEELATGPIVLWRRKNGRLEVITGRHRLDLARRTAKTEIPSQIVNESYGFTKDMARVLDAEANIRDGQGSTGDFADYFRNSAVTLDEAKAKGLLSRAKGKAGYDIGRNASEDTYTLFRNGKITDDQALAITRSAPGDDKAQAIGIKYALDGKAPDFVANIVKVAVHNSGGEPGTIDLFGRDDAALKAMEAQASRAAKYQREIKDQIAAVQGAARRPEEARKLGVDVKDPEAILGKIAELKSESARWDNWPQHSDLVTKTRGEAPAPDLSLTPDQPKAEAPKPAQQGMDLRLKGDALRAPERGAGSGEPTELERSANEAADRANQVPLFSKNTADHPAPAFYEEGQPLFKREEYKLKSASEDIQKTVKTLTDKIPTLKGKVEVVKSETDLPDHLKSEVKSRGFEGTVEGVFDPKDGKVYVVSNNIFGANRVEQVLRHELTHRGIRNVLGDKVKPVFQQIYKQFENTKEMSKVITDYDLNTDKEGGKLTAVDEFIARHGEQYQKQPVIQRMISMIRHELRKMGFSIKWSDKDIMDLAGAALKSEGMGEEIRFSTKGKEIKDIKQEQTHIYDDLKKLFNDNIEHWTWFNGDNNPIWLIKNRPGEIPSTIKDQVEGLYNKYLSLGNQRIDKLTRYVNKNKLKDFSLDDLKENISYSDMGIATGWKAIRDENGPFEYALENTNAETVIQRFSSREEAEKYAEENGLQFINPVGPERIYFRVGKLPDSGKSYNHMTNQQENGVSVYVTPKAGSLAGLDRNDWFYGKGRQIDTGGDDEPVIVPVGKWEKFNIEKVKPSSDPSRSPQSGDQSTLARPEVSAEKSNLNPFQREQVKTPEFKKWFGKSAVVDENGEPLVVYHGTTHADITKFLPNGGDTELGKKTLELFRKATKNNTTFGYMNFRSGTFFSPDPEYAGNYTAENTGLMYPVYIKAENPVYFDHKATPKARILYPGKTADALFMMDGDKINEVAVIEPNQIKSATGNTGEFNPKNKDIRFSRKNAEEDEYNPLQKIPRSQLTPEQVEQLKKKFGKVRN